ncbi:hypothetical protein IV203_007259 [Nitzschia inconspicua]|uniref:Uncharacterized protein n=1 Tax=Nitzschia inconspicua TaxID=303405 RepID=A0A9K3KEA6_9STRA|nr:hypothetical protein IV203_007259 [Nitzschia inconspicua]
MPTTPYTINEAYRILRQKCSKENQNDTTDVVDIMGFVTNLSISQPSAALAISTRKCSVAVAKCQLWLVDDSCFVPNGEEDTVVCSDSDAVRIEMARLCFYGTSEVARIQQEHIQVGDLLRFNAVSLKEDLSSSISSPCFHLSALFPEPGPRWCYLGSLHQRLNGAVRTTTDSMWTCPERVKELIDWFKKVQQSGPPNHNLFPTLQLPCRKRSLAELQASVGIKSNVQVRVTHIFSQPCTMVTSSSRRNNAKKRKYQHPVPQLAIATVTDDSGTVMTLVDTLGRFQRLLEEAMSNRMTTHLVVTNVLTQTSSSLRGAKLSCPTNEVVLTVTGESTAFLLPSPAPSDNAKVDTDGTQTYSFGRMVLSQGHDDTGKSRIELVSEVMDLIIDGLSLRGNSEHIFSSPATFKNWILLTDNHFACGGSSWRYKESAKVQLDKEFDKVNIFPITPAVLQCLCGGLDARDFISDDNLSQHSMNFVKSLLNDRVRLKFSLDLRQAEPKVIKTVLDKLPI